MKSQCLPSVTQDTSYLPSVTINNHHDHHNNHHRHRHHHHHVLFRFAAFEWVPGTL